MAGTDKLFAPIGGRPLLAWTLAAVAGTPGVERIVLVVAPERLADLVAAPWLPAGITEVIAGGDDRQASVAAGFAHLTRGRDGTPPADGDRVVLVHDGARPLATRPLIAAVIRAAAEHGAAIPVLPLAETIKRISGETVVETVDRGGLGTAQTPQGVRRGLLAAAYQRHPPGGADTWTDEAALLEASRIPVHVIPGDPSNIKVTLPADLRRAESVLLGGSRVRTGIGHDGHPFGPGEPLALGGISIAGAPRLRGHSDGDVALHALCDALLGAAALGDLGRVFPAGDATPEGIASAEMLAEVVRRVAAAGWDIANVDLTIIAARPRLGDHLEAMRAAIAATLAVAVEAVSVKASSGNLLGDDGAGRSISAFAVATLEAARQAPG